MASDCAILDSGPLRTKHIDSWAILADNAYFDSTNLLYVIHPKRKPAVDMLRSEDEQENSKLSTERIIVEIDRPWVTVRIMGCTEREMALF